MTSELSTLLGDLVTVTHRLTRVAAQATGDTTSPATWRTLSVLTTNGPLRLGALASASRVSQPTMTKIVAKLHEAGLIDRVADASDARASTIAITEVGAAALDDWRDRLGVALEAMFTDLSVEEQQTLREAVRLVGSRIDSVESVRT